MQAHDYRRDIDGLRAIAVMLVVIFHAFPGLLPGGFLGVDIFFVISGYLITGNILKDLERGSFSFLAFYGKRCRRILPALFTILFATLLIGYLCFDGIAFMLLGKHSMAGASFISNLLLLRESGYFDSSSELKPLLHLWSLSVEEQFYFAWPILAVFAFSRPRIGKKLALLLACFSFFLCVRWSSTYPSQAFYSILSRFWELALGCGLAFSGQALDRKVSESQKHIISFVALAFFVASQIFVSRASRCPGFWSLLPTLGAACLIFSGTAGWVNRKILASRPTVFVGLISYPLYLWHWPLLAILRVTHGSEPKPLIVIMAVVLSILLAIVTRKFIELPVQRHFSFREKNFKKSPLFALLLSAIASLLLFEVGNLVYREKIFSLDRKLHPDAFRLQRYSLYDLKNIRMGTCFLDSSKPFQAYSADCYTPKNVGKAYVLLLGDSLAANLFPGLEEVLRTNQIETLQLTASSCPPVLEVGEDRQASCLAASKFIAAKIKELHPETIILMGNWLAYQSVPGFGDRLLRSIQFYRDAGVRNIFVMGITPIYHQAPYKIMTENYIARNLPLPRRLKNGLDERVFETNKLMRVLLANSGIHYIELLDSLCDTSGCLSFVGPEISTDLLLYDEDHLTVNGAKYVSEKFIWPVLSGLR